MKCTGCRKGIDPGDSIIFIQFGRAKYASKSGLLSLDPTKDPLPFHEECLIDWSIEAGWLDEDEFYFQARELVEDDVRDDTIAEMESLGLLRD